MKQKTPKEFKKEVQQLVGNEYTLLEDYQLSRIPIKIRHNKCNNVYKVRPNGFLKGNRCPYCNGNLAKKKTTDQFKKEVYTLVGDEYVVLGEYINNATNILIQHKKCGRKYYVRPNNFLQGMRCLPCYHESITLTQEQASQRVHEALGLNYEIVGTYKSITTPVEILHLTCGNTFKVRVTDVVQKHSGCPRCVQSRGEEYISNWLDEKGIKYESQKRFENLRDKLPLSYDFYIPSLNVLIEYQGEQHFYYKTFGGISKEKAKENLALQKMHDKIKREYAMDNGYILIEPNFKLKTYSQLKDFMNKNLSI